MNKRQPKSPYLCEVALDRQRVPSFKKYPFNLAPIRDMDRLALHKSVTFIIGENGSGKSTLLEAIAVAWGFNAEGGSDNFTVSSRPSHSILYQFLKLGRGPSKPSNGYFLRAESFFNVATEIDELDREYNELEHKPNGRNLIHSYGGKSLHEQSHGEAFTALLLNRFSGGGFYILDEPEAALSPQRQLALLGRLHQLVKAQSQFVIATHSPIILAYPHSKILLASANGLHEIAYEDTEHYRVTRDFLDDPDRTLKHLLKK